ncbi:hypothetical protein M8C21_018401 [Ambrosia artemisiifolia]|uniref:Uncharacterized protein n=1 Tax=Ambrosia artemisiifolia TaxID=4212 RepID=A0AAD5BQU0_AMBAR|nr:hypothetical protein M8C21_018401 [Ambrosia artemisiifolia]
MSTGSSSASYGVRTFATMLMHHYRASSTIAASNLGNQHIGGGGMRCSMYVYDGSRHHALSICNGSSERPQSKKEHESNSLKVQPSDPDPPRAKIYSWVKWVEGVVKEVEEVAEAVEKVASTTEKLSAEVAGALNNGELKEAALKVEHVSNVIAKDARMTEDFIHKFGDLKQDLMDLEAMVEPVIDKMEHKK